MARQARGIPGGPLLGSLRELFVEAVESEESGIRDLRNTWRPFDVAVYQAFEARRTAAARLRRQVETGLALLLAEHDIRLPE